MLQIVVDMLTSPSWLQSILLVYGTTDRPNGVLFNHLRHLLLWTYAFHSLVQWNLEEVEISFYKL
jgi:hypothetical protein